MASKIVAPARGPRPWCSRMTCQITSGSMIVPGVHIGRGAVIGAHSLVTKDVLPFTVVAGVPARPIRHLDRLVFEQAVAQKGPRPAYGRT